ncbi:hypothetical protein PR003_g28137 [Phytophthora rubi]|uniref:Uncharacterized protein n=1 Tax=Phytophthora rubi TaxID=129364 RepID=A0A6A3HQH6_9STRA|nr:hypothetical protein PR002_g27974 [Phytophthora rubi]KAE8971252.1 hypothetical protein PR001_g26946 [Phytophthora rubi]KAE9279783.1 hypothetical protein PR003_g28137 [Phytophthora rubi]
MTHCRLQFCSFAVLSIIRLWVFGRTLSGGVWVWGFPEAVPEPGIQTPTGLIRCIDCPS